jgi:hypothetical protein
LISSSRGLELEDFAREYSPPISYFKYLMMASDREWT